VLDMAVAIVWRGRHRGERERGHGHEGEERECRFGRVQKRKEERGGFKTVLHARCQINKKRNFFKEHVVVVCVP